MIRAEFLRLLSRVPVDGVDQPFFFRAPSKRRMEPAELFLYDGKKVKSRGMEFSDVGNRVPEALEKGWVSPESYQSP